MHLRHSLAQPLSEAAARDVRPVPESLGAEVHAYEPPLGQPIELVGTGGIGTDARVTRYGCCEVNAGRAEEILYWRGHLKQLTEVVVGIEISGRRGSNEISTTLTAAAALLIKSH